MSSVLLQHLCAFVLFSIALAPLALLVHLVVDRSSKTILAYLGLVTLFIIANRTLFVGGSFPYHDTMADHYMYYAILNEWIHNGYAVGWNPFMNGGEPLYIYSNLFLWSEFIAFSLLNFIFNIPVPQLINVYMCFVIVSFSTYCLLLFRFVIPDWYARFFAFSAVLLGGLTISTLAQFMLSPLYLLPLALLSLYLFITRGEMIFLIATGFFIAVSANHYIPNYLILTLLVFLAASAIAWGLSRITRGAVPHPIGADREQPHAFSHRTAFLATILLALLALGALTPAFFVFREIQDLISPVRGNLPVQDHGIGLQALVDVRLPQYRFLFYVPPAIPGDLTVPNLIYSHSPFFVGAVVGIMSVLSLYAWPRRFHFVWLVTAAGVGLFGLGSAFPPWVLLRDRLPYFYLRHAYPLSVPITLFLVVLAGYGLTSFTASKRAKLVICVASIVLCLWQTSLGTVGDQRRATPFTERPFEYPVSRAPYTTDSAQVPIDAMPVLVKEASATNASDDYVLFRTPRYEAALEQDFPAVVGDLFVFAKGELPQGPPVPDFSQEQNELENGRLDERSSPHSTPLQENAGLTGFHIDPKTDQPLVVTNTDSRWIRSGRYSLRADLTTLNPRVVIEHDIPNAASLWSRFVEASYCIASPQHARVAIELQLAQSNASMTRSPRTIDLRPDWQCIEQGFYVEDNGRAQSLSLIVASSEATTLFIDQIWLKPFPVAFANPVPTSVRLLRSDNPNDLELEVEAPSNGFLVRKENFHPGWTATINGMPTEIRPYGPFQALPLTAGTNIVRFQFHSIFPELMWLHVVCTFAGYLIFFVALARVIARLGGGLPPKSAIDVA